MSSRRAAIEPRLLSRKQAALYCGMCAATFDRICPVNPVDIGLRNHLFDRQDLDRWIDGLNAGKLGATDWLGRLGDDGHGDAHKGH